MRIICLAAGVLLAVAAITIEWTQRHEGVRAATVTVEANASLLFVPQDVTITAGDTVQWTVVGAAPHTVTSEGGSFTSSGTLTTGQTYSLPFNTAGQFTYYCDIHAVSGQYPGGMTGRITVQAVPTATATATNTTTAATATATATRTPTRTATGTPQATGTPIATATAPAATATPVVVAPISATQPAGGAAPSLGAPVVGDGSASQGGGSPHALSITLAALGAAMIAGAVAARRRA